MSLLFLLVVLAALIAVLPRWSFSRDWGYGPTLGLSFIFVIALMVVLVNGWADSPGGGGATMSGQSFSTAR